MEENKNYSIAVDYQLFTLSEGKRELEEKTDDGQPFRFLSGFGMTLDAFEQHIVPLNEGDKFDFTLSVEQGYGERVQERVIDLDKQMFCVNGKFDVENIFVDAIVPLQNADGQRFLGHVLDITDDKVLMDLNHPLAGMELNFVGTVVEKREAMPQEIQAMMAHLAGEGGCGGCSGGCNGGCNGGCESGCCEGGCGK